MNYDKHSNRVIVQNDTEVKTFNAIHLLYAQVVSFKKLLSFSFDIFEEKQLIVCVSLIVRQMMLKSKSK